MCTMSFLKTSLSSVIAERRRAAPQSKDPVDPEKFPVGIKARFRVQSDFVSAPHMAMFDFRKTAAAPSPPEPARAAAPIGPSSTGGLTPMEDLLRVVVDEGG